MKLMTKEIAKKLPLLGATSTESDPIVQVKYFDIMSSWTWYATEYNPETGEMFGWVDGSEPELGYFNLNDFEHVNKNSGFPRIERDLYFDAKPISEVKKG